MSMPRHNTGKIEFGDFQTPPALAQSVCQLLDGQGLRPASILEPTCGIGNFLFAAMDQFPTAIASGVEINDSYFRELERRALTESNGRRLDLQRADFSHLIGRVCWRNFQIRCWSSAIPHG